MDASVPINETEVNELRSRICIPSSIFETPEVNDVLETIRLLLDYIKRKRRGTILNMENLNESTGSRPAPSPEVVRARLEARYQIALAMRVSGAGPEAALAAWTEGDTPPAGKFREYVERRAKEGNAIDFNDTKEETLDGILKEAGIGPSIH